MIGGLGWGKMTDAVTKDAGTINGEEWAGEMGAKWLASLDQFEGMNAPIGAALLARADYNAGERVLDIGSGGGATTLSIAKAVGPSGAALGIDISPYLVAAATARAQQPRLGNVQFLCADAGRVALDSPPFDRLFSRFGYLDANSSAKSA